MIIRTLEALFTLKTNATEFRKATKEVDNFADNANKVLKAVAGHFVFQAITGFITETSQAMADIGKTAGYLGITTSALQEMRYAAEKSGVTIDTLDDSLKELQIRAVDSLSGSGEAFDAFNKLKVNPKDALGRIRAPLDLLDEVADKLIKLPTQSERIWVVDSMFGDQGAMMLKMLKGGSDGLAKLRVEARSLGHVLEGDAISKAEKFNQELNRMKAAFSGVVNALIQGIMPGLTQTMETLGHFTIKMNESEATAKILRLGIVALGEGLVYLAIKAGLALMGINPVTGVIAAGVGVLTFVIADLWSAFEGGDSVLKSMHSNMVAYFKSSAQFALILGKRVSDFLGLTWLTATIKDTVLFWRITLEFFVAWLGAKIGNLGQWLLGGVGTISKSAHKILGSIFPDSLKTALVVTTQMNDGGYVNARMAHKSSYPSIPNRMTSNQSINVAVNVKSGADPQMIGGEVSKAIRAELEKERFNTFMGVSHYAN